MATPPGQAETWASCRDHELERHGANIPGGGRGAPGGGVAIKVPFDPATAWGDKDRHYVPGTIERYGVRGSLTDGRGHYLLLGPAWCRDPRVGPGAQVTVALEPEGPQFAALATMSGRRFEAEPGARRFFESLATFYRNGLRRLDRGGQAARDARHPHPRHRRPPSRRGGSSADAVRSGVAGRRGISEQEALAERDLELDQRRQLRLGLDALGDQPTAG